MDRKQLLEKIIAREAAMFIAVKASEPADCQEMLKTFYLMREMSHSVLAADTLTSYLQDLETAAAAGRNLMTEKYARMENLIPSLNENDLISLHIFHSFTAARFCAKASTSSKSLNPKLPYRYW